MFGKGIVYDSPLDERTQQVKLLLQQFSTNNLKAMVPQMIEEAEEYFRSTWGDEGEADLRDTCAELILLTASRCLMGHEVRASLHERVAEIYHALDGGMTPLSTLWPNAPTKAHRDRDAAREEMVEIFTKVIAGRRGEGAKVDDFLQKIIDFRYRDEVDKHTGKVLKAGRGFSDQEVTGWLIVLLFAGQHTSSITATWLGAMLLSHKGVLGDVLDEQRKLVPDGQLSYENLFEMQTMRQAISEVLRKYPPLVLLARKVVAEGGVTVGPYTIPKGDVVAITSPITNMDERYWSDPQEYKPSRFAEGAEEASYWSYSKVEHGPTPAMMLSFGGGHHMCSGRRFGMLQVSTIWSILLRDFDMELTSPVPGPKYDDMVVGPDGPIMVKYKRKKVAKSA